MAQLERSYAEYTVQPQRGIAPVYILAVSNSAFRCDAASLDEVPTRKVVDGARRLRRGANQSTLCPWGPNNRPNCGSALKTREPARVSRGGSKVGGLCVPSFGFASVPDRQPPNDAQFTRAGWEHDADRGRDAGYRLSYLPSLP